MKKKKYRNPFSMQFKMHIKLCKTHYEQKGKNETIIMKRLYGTHKLCNMQNVRMIMTIWER